MTKLLGTGPILIVDDDDVDIVVMRRLFMKSELAASYELQAVTSARGFLDYMSGVGSGENLMPSLILLDINMPVMNGFDAMQAIRSQPLFHEVPAIMFVSNSDDPRDSAKAKELGAGFVEKFDEPEEGIAFFNMLASSA